MCRDAGWEEEEEEEEEQVSRNLSLGDPLVIRDNARPRDCDCRVRVSPISQTFVPSSLRCCSRTLSSGAAYRMCCDLFHKLRVENSFVSLWKTRDI